MVPQRAASAAAGTAPVTVPGVIRIAHLSDTHLGYEAHRACTPEGHNQRGVDVIEAWRSVCADIDRADPDLVIHSGDILDRPQVPVRYLLALREGLELLSALRPDGTRRQVIVIAGNHDAPHNIHEHAALDLFATMPGVHIASRQLRTIDFTDQGDLPASLRQVSVTAIPHDALLELARDEAWDDVRPTPGRVSILTTHGIVGGSSLYKRGIGREYAVPARCLDGWDYVALGHWHRRGPVDPARRAWYAGSSENCGFGDVQDDGQRRGWLEILLTPRSGDLAELDVTTHDVDIRPMRYLPTLDATGMDSAQVTDELIARASDTAHTDAVIAQVVTGITRDTWSLVDVAAARTAAAHALHYQVVVRAESTTTAPEHTDLPLPDAALEQALEEIPTERREPAADAARTHLADVRTRALTSGRTGRSRSEAAA